ncbi:myo-inositol-1-phosphate synthase [Puccinia graminis f. sp. tritici CRL 75-36-700-3]|uniref:Inositol-3-phosphate synthase n=1 Tax=Puccinia graminis f. sp. tritici (strain CRL 75-36-700-3 / race SCCL) TaxID=418459 RepID=E3KGF0_PUCGT|nr:myo-inositol-1-phosphate synthase [Puccinia graminis f. sp. tritici CRL 75-36-700-3]EFP83375.2 myo-inositol-1-phosphate synthase [Puccinia graminis f. sp. tritici CRL 75-36-700-3]
MSPPMAIPNAQSVQPTNRHSNGVSNGHSAAVPIVDPTAMRRPVDSVRVESEQTAYTDTHILATSVHENTLVTRTPSGGYVLKPTKQAIQFKTERQVPTTGLMLVGWGGNNGTTVTATILANKHNISWRTREGIQTPNYIGSIVRASTLRLGSDAQTGKDVHIPLSDMLPMVHPNDLVLGGWDISGMPLDQAMRRAKVMEWDLQDQLNPLMSQMKPLPSVYYPDFINANQEERADNVLPGTNKQAHLDQIRKDIRDFKAANKLDKVIVLWTANTERYSELIPGINDTARNLEQAVKDNHDEVSPSTIFAMACIYEGAPYINGAPQNTFVPGCVQLAEELGGFIGGDDFKSGQTKIKSCLAEFLVNSGIKPLSIASYNHLGNNDGRNLNAQKTFRSKEISKSSVVDDMVEANHLLYKPLLEAPKGEKKIEGGGQARKTEHPDHCVVIKYMPSVGDDKVALDEYYSELAMGGRNKIVISNTCQDSLLAIPLIIDLVIITELLTRVQYRKPSGSATEESQFQKVYPVLSLLSSMLKAPLVRPGTDVINGAARQRAAIDHFLRALIGLQPLTEWEQSKIMA